MQESAAEGTSVRAAVTESLDVIAVGAHPDDVEIACGGTLAKLASQGYRVGIIDLTNGEPTPGCPDPDIRLAEAQAAADVLGVAVRKILPFPNRRLFDGFDVRVALATEFRRYRPKIVIGFGNKTPMASPDHYQAMLITEAAIFYSRLTKWDEHFEGLPVHAIPVSMYFQLAFEAVTDLGFSSQITIDISDQLEKKLAAVHCYKTQFPPEKQRIFERVRSTAIACGNAAGFEAGETLASARPLGCVDLMQAMLPPPRSEAAQEMKEASWNSSR
jgi:N-acetylglucosamine malate deacetylase 1